MPTGSKSSASSATRKKHARKAATENDTENVTQPTRIKPSKKQIKKGIVPPPKKSYIPPSKFKPAPPEADPLDGLAPLLPSDLVLMLRKLSKKDTVTKTRALEELEAYVKMAKAETQVLDSGMIEALVLMLPVWLHRFPALCVHPSRRLRQLAAILHTLLLSIPDVRNSIIAYHQETGSETGVLRLLGAWCLSAWDVDRGVSQRAIKSWTGVVKVSQDTSIHEEHIKLDDAALTTYIVPFVITTIMDPSSTYIALIPPVVGDSAASSPFGTPTHVKKGVPNAPSIRKALEGESAGPIRVDEDPESIEDRNARLRTSALGALKWIIDTCVPTTDLVSSLQNILLSSLFWSVLNHDVHPPFLQEATQGLGFGQPIVRRAGWLIINALVGFGTGSETLQLRFWLPRKDGHPDPTATVATAVLRSAFVESDPTVRGSMWEPFLLFLTRVNGAWLLSRGNTSHRKETEEAEGNDESNSEGQSNRQFGPDPEYVQETGQQFEAYNEFLTFLNLGCNGSSLQGYPTVLVILSTIPQQILPTTLLSLTDFFDALWSAIDGQALSFLSSERAKGTEAFLSAWGECLVWLAGKLVKGGSDGAIGSAIELSKDIALALVGSQFMKLVSEFSHDIKVNAGARTASVLNNLEAISPDLLDTAWNHIVSCAMSAISQPIEPSGVNRTYILTFLSSLQQELREDGIAKQYLQSLIRQLGQDLAIKCQDGDLEDTSDVTTLQVLIDSFGAVLKTDAKFLDLVSHFLVTQLPQLLSGAHSVVLSYLQLTQNLTTWQHVLSTLGSPVVLPMIKRLEIFRLLIDFPGLDLWAKPHDRELQGLTEQALDEALTGDDRAGGVIIKLLQRPGPFISADAVYNIVSNIVTTLDFHIQPLLRSSDASAPESIEILRSALCLLLALNQQLPLELPDNVQNETMPRLFVLAYIIPEFAVNVEETAVARLARTLWEGYSGTKGEINVKKALKKMITQTDVRVSSVAILNSLTELDASISPMEILPSQAEFLALLSTTSSDPLDPTLAIIEPLIPSSTSYSNRTSWNTYFDSAGYSPYARASRGLLHLFSTDRSLARANLWGLQHILTLALFASEAMQVPGAENPVFLKNKFDKELKEIIRASQKVAAFLLASSGESDWHRNVVAAMSPKGKGPAIALDSMGDFIKLIFEQAKARNTVRDSLILHTVLQHVLPSTAKVEADGWIDLARDLEEQSHQTSLAIALAVTEFAPEPPRLDKYRNELASKISGVPPSKASTTGYRLLRSLNAVAPDSESDVIFLPQQRAIFLVKALQTWMGSDEEIEEAVEVEVTKVLADLAPILLGLEGTHWEFVIDLVESNIENCSFRNSETLLLLSRTLRLVTIITDLAAANKYLKGLWAERSKTILMVIRDLLDLPTPRTTLSVPRAVCREQAMTIVQGLPGSLMDENTLSVMCHLITDPSVENQKMAYYMLQQAAFKRTEHLVVEAGVETENTLIIELPKELLVILQTVVSLDDSEGQDPLTYLLAWLLVFDLFSDASLRVKTAYVDQIRNLDLVGTYFLPSVFDILGVGIPGGAFKLDPWSVNEYWLATYDEDAPPRLQLLAAHVYYRALLTIPSLIRTWWEDLKDRQLSSAISTFTSSYFSPVLIASELGQIKSVKDDPGVEPLTDDTFNVKVATTINEVIATFNVDEQQMEIGVKLPIGYPLRTVEVRPVRRVGVTEKVWRRWLFAVQQVITAHNGRIVDGLALFKKTVNLHFEGQVECAICYSILHVVDRSLPTKPCKTCKNRFHAGCLYKWFNTSHSSSCPLCRSDIM